MTAPDRNLALIALGANLAGTPAANAAVLDRALARIHADLSPALRVSRFWRTPAFPAGSGPDFVNACTALATDRSAGQVLAVLHEIEASLGRERNLRWAPRTIDLDLLALGPEILPDRDTLTQWMGLSPDRQRVETPDRLILPHPRLHQRAFVLIPLAEVAPDWRHPLLGRTVTQMAEALDPADRASMTVL